MFTGIRKSPMAVLSLFAASSLLFGEVAAQSSSATLDDAQLEEIVARSYQYIAMYNVNNKAAMDPSNPLSTGGWNRVRANTALADHTMKAIARPNNDTLYVSAMLDLRDEPVILSAPAFDSDYVSLMVTGYDHYVNVPMSTRLGDFARASRILLYTERSTGYSGEPVDGIDKVVEMSGDFVSAVYRVMPHANEPERMQRILKRMGEIRATSLSEYRSGQPAAQTPVTFPNFGVTDFDIYEKNFLEVMQFVVNHTTFDPDDSLDQAFLDTLAPLGVVPGRVFEPSRVTAIDGARLRAVAEQIAREQMALANEPEFIDSVATALFQPKGQMTLDRLVFQSVIGPIGLPASEAVYPPIFTTDGAPMSAMHSYVIRMTAEQMPPAEAFWSVTLYDTENGFFMPNPHKKYSVGKNAGMRLDEQGGIAIYISPERPMDVAEENWLPTVPGDYGMNVIMRLYAPDLERFASWAPPRAERLVSPGAR